MSKKVIFAYKNLIFTTNKVDMNKLIMNEYLNWAFLSRKHWFFSLISCSLHENNWRFTNTTESRCFCVNVKSGLKYKFKREFINKKNSLQSQNRCVWPRNWCGGCRGNDAGGGDDGLDNRSRKLQRDRKIYSSLSCVY